MMHQSSSSSKPPIAAKPKITQKKSYVFVNKNISEGNEISLKNTNFSNGVGREIECNKPNKNSEESNETKNELSYFKKHMQIKTDLKSCSQSFEDLSSKLETEPVSESIRAICEKRNNHVEVDSVQLIGNSRVLEMKSKLFAQQQQTFKTTHISNEPSISINRQQYKKSSNELEKVLGRQKLSTDLKNDKIVKRLSKSFDDACVLLPAENSVNLSKHIQQKLTAEMKQKQCEIIKDKFLYERIPVQQHYEEQTNTRNQPNLVTIGIKQTSKARPTIFGTVASDQIPKDTSSRRGLPQDIPSTSESSARDFESDENTLIYRDGNLLSASLASLIQHCVPTNVYYPERSYIFAFLLSSRLFIKPHLLLSKIWDLSQQQQNLKSFIQQKLAQNNPKLASFTKHLIQLLAEWVETFPYDFRDERLMTQLRDITQISIQINPSLRAEVSQMLQNLLSKLESLENYEEYIEKFNCDTFDECDSIEKSSNGLQQQISVLSNHSHKSTSSSSSIVSTLTHQTDISEVCSSPLVLAQQLTHIELERLSHIGPEEFVQAFTKEHSSIENSFKDLKKTRNLESYVAWFNRLSFLVCTDVIKHSKKKQRARIIEFWVETGREAFNIGNFNSLMAIIAGLNMSPISRLKKTWAKIQSAKFSILEHQMDSSSNFSSYRSTLKAAMWRSAGATDERERIVIPFFSLLVKDLYFLNEAGSNKLPNGHINFEKFWQLAKQVTEFINWKQVACPFEKNEVIINYLQTTSILNENTLAIASFECEPPENNHEKEHFKFLKNEHAK